MDDEPSTTPQRLADGRLWVQTPTYGPDGVIGEAWVAIGPEDGGFAAWDAWLRERGL